MKGIILAAGVGSRFPGLPNDISKTTLPIQEGLPLIHYTIQTLRSLGVSDMIVVTGYDRENVENLLQDMGVRLVHNPAYETSNSIGSLALCDDHFDGSNDLLILNGDSFYERELIESVAHDSRSPILLVDRDRRQQADVKVLLNDDRVVKYGKEFDEPADAESTDLVKLNAVHAPVYARALRAMMDAGEVNCYWEDVLFRMPDHGVIAKSTEGVFWSDIDRAQDYERILQYLKSTDG